MWWTPKSILSFCFTSPLFLVFRVIVYQGWIWAFLQWFFSMGQEIQIPDALLVMLFVLSYYLPKSAECVTFIEASQLGCTQLVLAKHSFVRAIWTFFNTCIIFHLFLSFWCLWCNYPHLTFWIPEYENTFHLWVSFHLWMWCICWSVVIVNYSIMYEARIFWFERKASSIRISFLKPLPP